MQTFQYLTPSEKHNTITIPKKWYGKQMGVIIYPVGENEVLDLEFLKDEIQNHVLALCKGRPRNYRNVKRLTQAGDYIATAFGELGYTVTRQSYTVKGKNYFNVIAELPGQEVKPFIVVGGHYDVCGNTPGADDNASAIAVMLALARTWKPLADEASVRLQFVAYTLEEPPFFMTDDMGSRVHAKSLVESGATPECVIVLDMLGYYNYDENTQNYPGGFLKMLYPYPSVGNFLLAVTRSGDKKNAKLFNDFARDNSNLPVEYFAQPFFVSKILDCLNRSDYVNFSDHYSYWLNGFSAFMLTDTAEFRNPHYHELSDTPDTLDYARMAETTQLLARFLFNQ